MEKKVYGISIDDAEGYNATAIELMSPNERYRAFVEPLPESLEVYGLEEFFKYLNNDDIDTINKYWFTL